MLDVVMLAYGEEHADENFKRIQKLAPHAKRIDNVVGILEAHQAAAQIATTDNFYVVDADAELVDHFDFSFTPDIIRESYPGVNESSCIFVWHSVNAVNGLIYGYGGVKLFPRHKLLKATSFDIDMTTTIDAPLVIKQQVSNISAFNTDAFSTWRSAFRECVKLSTISNPSLADKYRLEVWCSQGDSNKHGKHSIMGARQGREFGGFYKDDKNNLDKINDYDWLKSIFSKSSTNTLDQHYPIHLSWFHGLEEYFTLKQTSLEAFIKIKKALVYGDNWSIRDLILEEVNRDQTDNPELYVNVILQSLLIDDYVIPDHDVLTYISRHIDDDFINGLVNLADPVHGDIDLAKYVTRDSMSGNSWMIEELNKITLSPHDIVLLGGKLALHTSMLLHNYSMIESVISVDINHKKTEYARLLNHVAESSELFSAQCLDASDILWDEATLPDLLINTSAAHMDDKWFDNIPDSDDTLIVIQTNDCADNVNCVRDLPEALTKYNLKEVLFSGEQSTQLYNRFMIIGIK